MSVTFEEFSPTHDFFDYTGSKQYQATERHVSVKPYFFCAGFAGARRAGARRALISVR
jgi:hypothetical protein